MEEEAEFVRELRSCGGDCERMRGERERGCDEEFGLSPVVDALREKSCKLIMGHISFVWPSKDVIFVEKAETPASEERHRFDVRRIFRDQIVTLQQFYPRHSLKQVTNAASRTDNCQKTKLVANGHL
jgi:hypothetical protein